MNSKNLKSEIAKIFGYDVHRAVKDLQKMPRYKYRQVQISWYYDGFEVNAHVSIKKHTANDAGAK